MSRPQLFSKPARTAFETPRTLDRARRTNLEITQVHANKKEVFLLEDKIR